MDAPDPDQAAVACARMYAVTGESRAAWRTLFHRIAETAEVALEVIDHSPPAPLDDLWARDDLGCVFMCGWPYATTYSALAPIAAPVPVGNRYGGEPVYFTDLVVRRDRGYHHLEDTFGGRLGWTVDSSHSGYNALRHHLLPHYLRRRHALYAETVGPLYTPREALASVSEGRVDIAPLDSYALDLITAHESDRVADIIVLEHTAAAPIPLLVARPGLAAASRRRLTHALAAAATDPALQPTLATLRLQGFRAVNPADYAVLPARAREALEAGYPEPA